MRTADSLQLTAACTSRRFPHQIKRLKVEPNLERAHQTTAWLFPKEIFGPIEIPNLPGIKKRPLNPPY
jgi:hypothetical protein